MPGRGLGESERREQRGQWSASESTLGSRNMNGAARMAGGDPVAGEKMETRSESWRQGRRLGPGGSRTLAFTLKEMGSHGKVLSRKVTQSNLYFKVSFELLC